MCDRIKDHFVTPAPTRAMLPLLYELHPKSTKSEPPPAPTDDGESRYFYIMHRIADAPNPYPDGAQRVVKSGGVKPGGHKFTEEEVDARDKVLEMMGKPPVNNFREDGMDLRIVSFLEQLFDPKKGADTKRFKGLVAWYYLNNFNRNSILSFASDDELVFRVPEAWLQKHVTSCLEAMPRMVGDRSSKFLPFVFLTTEVVPLEYRITSVTPLDNENTRKMETVEVRDLIYEAHVRIDKKLRDESHFIELHRERRAKADEEEARHAALPRVWINPF